MPEWDESESDAGEDANGLPLFKVTGHWLVLTSPSTVNNSNKPTMRYIDAFVDLIPRVPQGFTARVPNLSSDYFDVREQFYPDESDSDYLDESDLQYDPYPNREYYFPENADKDDDAADFSGQHDEGTPLPDEPVSTDVAPGTVTGRLMTGTLSCIDPHNTPDMYLMANSKYIQKALKEWDVEDGKLIYDVKFRRESHHLQNFAFEAPKDGGTVDLSSPDLKRKLYKSGKYDRSGRRNH